MSYQQKLNRQLWNHELNKWCLCSKEIGLLTFTVIYFNYVATGHMPQIGRTTQVVKTRQEIVAESCKDVFSNLVKHKIDSGHVGLQTINHTTSATTQIKELRIITMHWYIAYLKSKMCVFLQLFLVIQLANICIVVCIKKFSLFALFTLIWSN